MPAMDNAHALIVGDSLTARQIIVHSSGGMTYSFTGSFSGPHSGPYTGGTC